MEIRKAVTRDKLAVHQMVLDFLTESKNPLTTSYARMDEGFDAIMSSPNGVLYVAEVKGEVVGMVAAVLAPSLFSEDNIAVELLWYMKPEYRTARGAFKLMDKYEEWARAKNVKVASMTDTHQLADLQKLYERKGWMLSEKTYIKVL